MLSLKKFISKILKIESVRIFSARQFLDSILRRTHMSSPPMAYSPPNTKNWCINKKIITISKNATIKVPSTSTLQNV